MILTYLIAKVLFVIIVGHVRHSVRKLYQMLLPFRYRRMKRIQRIEVCVSFRCNAKQPKHNRPCLAMLSLYVAVSVYGIIASNTISLRKAKIDFSVDDNDQRSNNAPTAFSIFDDHGSHPAQMSARLGLLVLLVSPLLAAAWW
jgi:hypothetical protein